MPRLTKDRTLCRTNRPLRASRWLPSRRFGAGSGERLLLALLCTTTLAGILILSACGSGSSSTLQANVSLSGNWQFTMAPPGDGSFLGGLQGGFVVQSGSSATGAAAYAVSSPQLPIPCNTGSAAITGTISGQDVTITAVAGTQTLGCHSIAGLERSQATRIRSSLKLSQCRFMVHEFDASCSCTSRTTCSSKCRISRSSLSASCASKTMMRCCTPRRAN